MMVIPPAESQRVGKSMARSTEVVLVSGGGTTTYSVTIKTLNNFCVHGSLGRGSCYLCVIDGDEKT